MPYEQPLGAFSMTTVQSATSYRHFERSEKSLSFAVSRSMIVNSKRETCYPLTFGHRPIYIAAKLPPQPWTLKPLPFLKTLHEKTLDTAASNWYNNTRLSQEPVKRSPKERRKTSWQTKANVILSHKSHDRAANTDRSKAQMKTRPWKKISKKTFDKTKWMW